MLPRDPIHPAGTEGRIEELERQLVALRESCRRAERETHWARLAGVALFLLLALVALQPRIPGLAGIFGDTTGRAAYTSTDKGIGSAEFSLRNAKNLQMSVLECDKFGAPNLVMMDLKQRYRVGLKVWDDDKADLTLYDAQGRLRGRFGVAGDGAVALVLSTEEGKENARLSVSSDGEPTLRLMNAQGNVVFQAP